MAELQAFDPQTFLAKVGTGRTVVSYPMQRPVFSQGEAADAVYYLQDGQVKLTVVSAQGKEAVIAILAPQAFLGEGCLAGQQGRPRSLWPGEARGSYQDQIHDPAA